MLYRKFDQILIYGAFKDRKYARFADWQAAAARSTQVLIQWKNLYAKPKKGVSLPVENEIYGVLKQHLMTYFCGKCAYCESEFASVAFGDVEHYRPKRGVSEAPEHPGYYWLAYCESNLLPSCEICNRGKGKRNHFPISGVRAVKPEDDLSQEQPLLLNPYEACDCGSETGHLRYIFEYDGWEPFPTGRVEGVGEQGKISVELYRLNRRELVNKRRKNQVQAIKALKLVILTPSALAEEWQILHAEDQEHATAVRAACFEWLARYKSQIDKATGS
jgi:hypothetical protein